ncbi:hypothetical protein HYDPIDRAFT_119745, partial [Hydnomerulius pinastri MD-312]
DDELEALKEFLVHLQQGTSHHDIVCDLASNSVTTTFVQYPNFSSQYTVNNPSQSLPVTTTPSTSSSPTGPFSTTGSLSGLGFRCRWLLEESGIPCDEVLPDRKVFLLHLGAAHGAKGSSDELVTCRLRDNLPRHVDGHYGWRVYCPYCPKSYSRRDTLKDHIRDVHAFQN